MLELPCPDCGFDPAAIRRADIADRIEASAVGWAARLDTADARVRPDSATWSVPEYGCHVRDVHDIMRTRLELMPAQDDPPFPNRGQDATAVDSRYDRQSLEAVSIELDCAADLLVASYRGVPGAAWRRPGRRSDGSRFTVHTLGVYALHDLEHHRVDVGSARAL
ncbi:DinB family protein [Tsukamurella soli]|uniref:DinB family protein n=1 Tax=Tsukamurella soli TaxID=644556 RepID=UPI0031EB2D1B